MPINTGLWLCKMVLVFYKYIASVNLHLQQLKMPSDLSVSSLFLCVIIFYYV